MKMKGPWMGDENEYRYKYNGIEEIDDFGLDLSFAAFRTLDPSIGRWLQVDPKGEAVIGLSPYQSMGNNPISFSDPEGDIFGLGFALAPLAGFIRGIDQVAHGGGIGGFIEGFGQGALNSVKIDLGYFAWDSNRNLGGNYLSIMSRFIPKEILFL